MSQSSVEIWGIIVALGLGTYLIRFSFLGLIGDRPLPPFVMRMLRYTPVAVLPGLVAPLVIFPEATAGAPDPARLSAAIATIAVGIWTKNVLWAVLAGFGTLYTLLPLLS